MYIFHAAAIAAFALQPVSDPSTKEVTVTVQYYQDYEQRLPTCFDRGCGPDYRPHPTYGAPSYIRQDRPVRSKQYYDRSPATLRPQYEYEYNFPEPRGGR